MLHLGTALRRGGAVLALAAALAAPVQAGVRDGVEAWSRGDYAAAVAEWQGPAAAGDADAMFNLGQAYRLGRGVPQDLARAESLYAAAAEAGHVQAADTYGLMMFQDGRRQAALPYVQSAARRGDPRAQYLLGIAHFNGDLVERDWTRAYALLTLANAAGLPQATEAIGQMDAHIPMDQRQAGAALARTLESEAESARSVELAAADLATGGGMTAAGPAPGMTATPSPRRPARPEAAVSVSPSVAAARAAVEQARQATGTSSPADAGATFANAARPDARSTQVATAPAPAPTPAPATRTAPEPAPRPARVAAAAPTQTPAPAPTPAPARAARSDGPWRVQLGAFGVAGNAERLWNRLSSRAEIAGRQRLLIPTGRVTRLQAGGFASRNEAQGACNSLRRAGHECLVTRD